MSPSRLTVGLAMLASACDCPGFDEMAVEDPDGIATGEEIRVVRGAISLFAEATEGSGMVRLAWQQGG